MADTAVFQMNLRELSEFSKAVRQASPAVARGFKAELRKGGNMVAMAARVGSSWSSRIPGSIKVRTSGFSVSVIAGGANAPHAAPYEHDGVPGSFRHPVFGNREVWVPQKARPFLRPAFEAEQPAIVRGVINALDYVFDHL